MSLKKGKCFSKGIFLLIFLWGSSLFSLGRRYFIYRVKKGDTLYSIARKFQVSLKELARINRLSTNSWVYYGRKLKIPIRIPFSRWVGRIKEGITLFLKKGEKVYPLQRGKVVQVSYLRGYGRYVIIKHVDGKYSFYGNLHKILVREGEKVHPRKPISQQKRTSLALVVIARKGRALPLREQREYFYGQRIKKF